MSEHDTQKDASSESEPVQITKYDGTQVKNALDDEVRRYYALSFEQGHLHTDIKLLLGYFSAALAAGAFAYEYYTSFEVAKPMVAVSVGVYWVTQLILFCYTTFVEKNEIFIGYKNDKSGQRLGIMTAASKVEKYSSDYHLTLKYTDQRGSAHAQHQFTKSVAAWFTEDGTLDKAAFDKDLEQHVTALFHHAHQD
ncbi:signal peptidase complex subunit 2 [Syncephalastrum racemosum]|uniref:Signal peptidase complex subunit 2 n=1 Tax=Syncephalastrum racemosum TaxID=13706 RepID=A0A1X2H8T2_SYNRA|nr:signal peptidase complex subunit 2 [Syncephalastrum racemosum]